jgi:hypothetical protein
MGDCANFHGGPHEPPFHPPFLPPLLIPQPPKEPPSAHAPMGLKAILGGILFLGVRKTTAWVRPTSLAALQTEIRIYQREVRVRALPADVQRCVQGHVGWWNRVTSLGDIIHSVHVLCDLFRAGPHER